jgi:DNA-binding response OmpR family regulator
MKLKVLALSSPESVPWYRQLGQAFNKRGNSLICATSVSEIVDLLKEEKFDLALVDSEIKDLENTCFKISWGCRIPLAIVTDNAQGDWSLLNSIGIIAILYRTSPEHKIMAAVEGLGCQGRLHLPRINILAIEDDESIRDAIKICFRTYWSEVEVNLAATGQAGIDRFHYQTPDLIMLDLGLPDMSGFDVLQHVRAYSRIPIIMLTANNSRDYVIQAVQSGANDYLIKPFKPMELMSHIKNVVDRFSMKKTFNSVR